MRSITYRFRDEDQLEKLMVALWLRLETSQIETPALRIALIGPSGGSLVLRFKNASRLHAFLSSEEQRHGDSLAPMLPAQAKRSVGHLVPLRGSVKKVLSSYRNSTSQLRVAHKGYADASALTPFRCTSLEDQSERNNGQKARERKNTA
jgi:hypothetical protein